MARDAVAGPGVLVAIQVHFRFGQQILVVLERSLGLLELRGVGPVIEIDERVAFAHDLSFAVMDSSDYSGDLGGEGVGVDRRDCTYSIQVNGDTSRFRRGCSDWHALRGLFTLLSFGRGNFSMVNNENEQQDN